MFDKYKNLKIAVGIIFGLFLIIFIVKNVRFRTVKEYNEDRSKIAMEQESLEKEYESQTKDEEKNEELSSENDLKKNDNLNEEPTEETSEEDLSKESSDEVYEESSKIADNKKEEKKEEQKGETKEKKEEEPKETYSGIKVSIRVSVATLLKEENYSRLSDGIKAKIPAGGEIISTRNIYLKDNATVMDALTVAAQSQGISFYNQGGYVPEIAGIPQMLLDDKSKGYYSGWTYYVNGKMPGHVATEHKLKDGDQIIWWYSSKIGDIPY